MKEISDLTHDRIELTKGTANMILELIDQSILVQDEEEMKGLIDRLKTIVPFDFALCALGDAGSDGSRKYRILNVSYPIDWLEQYTRNNFLKIDPIVREDCLSSGLQFWHDTFKKYEDAASFTSAAEDFGLKAGYSYGLKTGSQKRSLFSFSSPVMKRSFHTETILKHIVPHLHQALLRIVPDVGGGRVELSLREKEVLEWAKNGKSNWEISVILSISEDTVKFHVKNILRKMDVANRTQAVAAALHIGLIGRG